MQDLEENSRIILSFNSRLKDLGDSLWHRSIRIKPKRVRS